MSRPGRCTAASLTTAAVVGEPMLADVDRARLAELNGVKDDLLRDVPRLRTYATAQFEAGLDLIAPDAGVNVSFVATHRSAQPRTGERRHHTFSSDPKRMVSVLAAAGI